MQVAVVGQGVIGLTTALMLQQRGFKVTIYNNGEMTSTEAGANWCSVAEDNDRRLQQFELETYRYFDQIAGTMGIMRVRCSMKVQGAPWFSSIIPGFQKNVDGYSYDSFTINVPVYLQSMTDRFLKHGGQIRIKHLQTIQEVPEQTIFNCSGLQAKWLVSDHDMFPIRGQTVLVRVPGFQMKETITKANERELYYIIPRDDGTILLGGTQEPYNWNKQPSLLVADHIVQGCLSVSQELDRQVKQHGLQVLRHGVGLRPGRIGGIRLERQQIGFKTVIHNYGHGGYGYQSSYGSSREAVNLLMSNMSKL